MAKHPAVAYQHGVLDGSIPACKLIRLVVERHARDLVEGPARGLHFDRAAAEHVIQFFGFLKHSKGEWAGQPFRLEPWQQFILWVLFGWKRADGLRRFRTAYIEVPRKNGKTTLVAGIGLYLMVADGEPGAEVFSAATKRDQAKLSWDEAVRMVKASAPLSRMVKHWRASDTLTIEATASKFQPLGADADTMDGLNIQGALIDELHAHKTRAVVDVLDTATGARRQPMIFEITTAGVDQASVCFEHHTYTTQLLEGSVADDAWFGFIATLDGPRTESFQWLPALRQLDTMCSCKDVSTTQIDQLSRAAFVTLATSAGIERTKLSAVLTTRTSLSSPEVCAEPATTSGSRNTIPNTRRDRPNSESSGAERTLSGARRFTLDTAPNSGDEPSSTNSVSGSTASAPSNTTPSIANRRDDAPSAESRERSYAWITATAQALFGGSSAGNVTPQSAGSEILRSVYNAHSTTCAVRRADLSPEGALTVNLTGDRWDDPTTWAKANPNYGVSVKPDDLQRKCDKARQMPAAQNAFLRLHLDVWTQQVTRWIDLDLWDENAGEVDLESLAGRTCYGGLDLASVSDLAAWVLVFPRGDDPDQVDILCRLWCPEARLTAKDNRYQSQYQAWARDGLLLTTPGNAVDYAFIKQQILEDATAYNLIDLNVDRLFQGMQVSLELQDEGLDVFPMGQGFLSMAAPMKEFERRMLGRKLHHGGNPILRWMAGNVAVRHDPADNLKVDKAESQAKVDGIVALVMALDRAMRRQTKKRSRYEDHGLEAV